MLLKVKKIKIIGLWVYIFMVLISCKKKEISEADKKEIKSTVNQCITDWHQAATDADADQYFGKMDSSSIYVGTDATENWTKLAFQNFAKPYFKKGKAWDFKPLTRNIYLNVNANIAWFDELLDTWMGICRGSGVLEYKENHWKIKHYVLSVTIPNDNIKQIIAINKKKDSVFRAKFNKKDFLK